MLYQKTCMPFFLFTMAALLFACGGLLMKLSDGLTRWQPALGVFLCFCAGAACQAVGMRRQEMGTSYTLVLGLEAVAALTIGIFIAGDRLTLSKVGAVLLILLGIMLLEHS